MLVNEREVGRLTARDLEIAGWLDRLIGASVDQIRLRFELGRSQAYLRLRVLERMGLVRRRAILAGRPALYTTRGRELGPSTYMHAHAVAGLIAELERGGATVATDVELRRERHGDLELSPLEPEALEIFRSCERIPDAVEALPGNRLGAYELELSSKGRCRRERILYEYAASRYAFVRWIVPDRRLRALLSQEASDLGVAQLVEVTV